MNYGLILFSDDTFQVLETESAAGITEDFCRQRNQSFVFLIAPKDQVDVLLGLSSRLGLFYPQVRRLQDPERVREAVLIFFNRPIAKVEADYDWTEETEWEVRSEYEIENRSGLLDADTNILRRG